MNPFHESVVETLPKGWEWNYSVIPAKIVSKERCSTYFHACVVPHKGMEVSCESRHCFFAGDIVSSRRSFIGSAGPEPTLSGVAMMPSAKGFPPIEESDATVLILGSMPGTASLAAGEYYAHPRNHFWPIMGELIGAAPGLPYEERLFMLKSAGIALWDVLRSCIRAGSLDSRIVEASVVPNDFDAFFCRHPGVTSLFFNGAKAEQCFLRHVLPSLRSRPLQWLRLPSTSPANAGTAYRVKLAAWRAVMPPGKEGSAGIRPLNMDTTAAGTGDAGLLNNLAHK